VKEIKVPGSDMSVIHNGSDASADRMQKIIDARHAFIVAYCKAKGWPDDLGELSMEQILEIRSQDGWKAPAVDGELRLLIIERERA
jgi:hypothetical protein